VRGADVFQLRDRRPFSGAGTYDSIRNLSQVGCGQFEGRGADPAVNLLRRAATVYPDKQYQGLMTKLPDVETADRSRLLRADLTQKTSSAISFTKYVN